MYIPLLDLKAQYRTIRDEARSAIDSVCESQHFILGSEVERLEKGISAYSHVDYAVGMSSGTDALLAALMALDVHPGDEVITTPFTFFSTAGTIARLGARIVFADIDPATFNINPAKLPDVFGPKTKAVIPVHLFGQCADMDRILELTGANGIPVIEDAAQSIGSDYKGRRAGSMGDMGIFSFFPSKNLGGFGDGGMVVTNNPDYDEKLRLLRVHGSKPKYFHKIVGGNFRLDAIQAAVLNVKLKYLDTWSAARRDNAIFYSKYFVEAGLTEIGDIVIPSPAWEKDAGVNPHIYNQYTLRCRQRDELQAYLKSKGIGTEIYYPLPLHLQECFAPLGYKAGDFPNSEQAVAEVLSLPVYPELAVDQREYIAHAVVDFYRS